MFLYESYRNAHCCVRIVIEKLRSGWPSGEAGDCKPPNVSSILTLDSLSLRGAIGSASDS